MSDTKLIEQAIESAKCRIYRIQSGNSIDHQKKAENQRELMIVTIKALKKQIPKLAKNIEEVYCATDEFDCVLGNCPTCGAKIGSSDADVMYCSKCGQLVMWDGE
jgi:hypothetical protein